MISTASSISISPGLANATHGDMLGRPASTMPNRQTQPESHKHAEVVHVIDDVRILLNDVRKRLRVNKCDRQLLVKRVVVPIHFGEAHDAGAGVVPAPCAGETPDEYWRRRWLERSFFVNLISGVLEIYSSNAA